jgi:O-glycosyl hydrolase
MPKQLPSFLPAVVAAVAAAMLLLLTALVLPIWPAHAATVQLTPTPTAARLRLPTPTPTRRALLPTVTPTTPKAQATPTRAATPAPSPTPLPGTVRIRIDASQHFQQIDGFGATHTTLIYDGGLGDVLGPDLRTQAIDAVYGQVGINLGNLDAALLESPSGYDQRANDNDDPAVIDWNGFQTGGAQTLRTGLLDRAAPLGFTGYFPAQKINVRWASYWLGELRAADYGRYLAEAAEQVEAGVRFWQSIGEETPPLLMLLNEPLSGNGELAEGSMQEVVDLVKTAAARLREQGFGAVRFVLPNEESVQKTLETTGALLADDAARAAIGVIGYHPYPYGSTYANIPNLLATSGSGAPDQAAVAERQELAALAQAAGLPLWMTEVSHGEVNPLSFDALRGRAIHIHDELRYAQASAYFGMNNMWDSESQRQHFGNSDLFDPANEGNIVLIDNDVGTVHITGMGYAIGHYARWLRPGAVRVEAASSDPLVQVTAMQSGGDSAQGATLVLVVINNAATPRALQIDVAGMTLGGLLAGEQSTSAAAWQPLSGAVKSAPNQVRLVVPAYSVTTLSAAP